MSALEIISLASITIGAVAIVRFVWLDSLRFADRTADMVDPARVSPRTVERLSHQAEAARVLAETESLPRAA